MNAGLSQNYFEIFGIPVSFELDQQRLAEAYRKLQSTVHPDKFSNASDRDRRLAVQQAALINEAFHTLKHPLKRARYLLQLKGIEFDDERATAFEPEFLMEQMALRETLADINGQSDPLGSLATLMQDIERRIRDMNTVLAGFINEDELEQARIQIHKLQFLEKLKSECEALEEELVDLA